MVTVTGSTATGRRVMAAAARRPTRVHLELGGKAPFVVFADADVAAVAAAAALASTYNTRPGLHGGDPRVRRGGDRSTTCSTPSRADDGRHLASAVPTTGPTSGR